MQFKRIAALAICLLVCALIPLSGCGAPGVRCVLEAENAVIEPEYDPDRASVSRANSRSENITSGGKYAGKMYAGNTVTWFFTAERQAECAIEIAVANAEEDSAGFSAGGGLVFSVSLNGKELSVPEFFVSQGTQYCDDWQLIDLGTFRVAPGINKLVYTALSDTQRLNVDYLALISDRADIKEHSHFWKTSSVAAGCTEDGYSQKTCGDCGYSYTSDRIAALGHQYGNYHYHDDTQKMVAVCERCGDMITVNTPDSRYFGEVFYAEEDYITRPDEFLYEAEEAFVCVDGGLNNGESYIKKDDGTCHEPSGGKLVENLSRIGNYIRFVVEAQESCLADLVFRMSNTMYSKDGIAELDPMSDYVYCTVNGEEVDFTFVAFPGLSVHDYFEWRYVVVKNVELTAYNVIEIGPKDNDRHWITMPNTDVLKICTDGVPLRAIKNYGINDVTCGEYTDGYENSRAFVKEDDFVLYAGAAAERADYVLTVKAETDVSNVGQTAVLTVNEATVNLEGIKLQRGQNTLVLRDVPVRELKNTVVFSAEEGLTLLAVQAFTDEPLIEAYASEVRPEYDYLQTQGEAGAAVPALIFEAENADLGDSVPSREGVELVETDIMENTGKPASGNSAVGNFAQKGNIISWRFTAGEQVRADIVLMLASAYYDESVNGNVSTRDLQEKIVVRVNGIAVKLNEIVLEVDSVANYYDWKAVTVPGCLLKKGENVVTVEALAYGAPNMDVLYVYADGAALAPSGS